MKLRKLSIMNLCVNVFKVSMDDNLLQKLKDWRKDIAQSEGFAPFRVFHDTTLEAIASMRPKTKEELLSIKGIQEKKFSRYGESILALINGSVQNSRSNIKEEKGENPKPYTISDYLGFLNIEFRRYKARVQGEVNSLDIRDNYLFFTLKDKDRDGVLHCFMWRNNYALCGVALEVGMEIVVDGLPEIYPPLGRLNFRVSTIELVGEGALKKAYDALKQKLEKEGLFDEKRKTPIPEFPQRIGLVTSETGAVIHDFLNNLGKYGYYIQFVNSRVEGQTAVHDLLAALDFFHNKDIDVLVIIRGGGSMESLQAFNNEALARKIADCSVPIICGIGHDKDVPLASLVADLMVSTPTAATVVLNRSWENAFNDIRIFERDILNKYQKALADRKYQIEIFSGQLKRRFDSIAKKFESLKEKFSKDLITLNYGFKNVKKVLAHSSALLLIGFKKWLGWLDDYLHTAEQRLRVVNPMRQLKLGYSIVSIGGKIVRSIQQVQRGGEIEIQVLDGKIQSQVKDIIGKSSSN